MLKDVGGAWRVAHSRTRTEIIAYKAHEPHEGCTGNLVIVKVDGNPDVRKAIGDLIARAPSMLALLEKAYPIIEEEAERRESFPAYDDEENNGEYWTEMRELANEIQTEIDKARGKGAQDG